MLTRDRERFDCQWTVVSVELCTLNFVLCTLFEAGLIPSATSKAPSTKYKAQSTKYKVHKREQANR